MTARPTLDREAEPWVARFPGLGSVTISRDGLLEVVPEPDVPGAADALRYGWGELLAYQRRGIALTRAISLAHDGSALLVSGDAHDCAIASLGLISRGWQLLADWPAPVTWDEEDLIAHARTAPMIASRRRARHAEVAFEPIRGDLSDAVSVEVPRADTDLPVTGVLSVRIARPHDPTLVQPRGAERVKIASGFEVHGALAQDEDPAARLARNLRWAQMPLAQLALRQESLEADMVACMAWWMEQRA